MTDLRAAQTALLCHDLATITGYVPGMSLAAVKAEYGSEVVVKLASNESALPPPREVVRAMRDAVVNAHLYPSGRHEDLRRDLADFYGLVPGQIYVGNGSDEIIRTITTVFLNRGEEVVLSDASYPDYEDATREDVGVVIKVPIAADLSVDLDAMAAAVTERTKLIFVCNPNNPTGTLHTHDEIERFLDRIPGPMVKVFDEAYFEFAEASPPRTGKAGCFGSNRGANPDSPPDTPHRVFPRLMDRIRHGENIIILRTFSKAYALAGIRVGYAIAPEAFIDAMYRLHMPFFNVNVAGLAGARAALKCRSFLQKNVELASRGKRYFYRHFRRLGISYVPSETNFVLMRLGDRVQPVFRKLLEGRDERVSIIVRPTASFGLEEGLRVSVGLPAQNRLFVRQLEGALAV